MADETVPTALRRRLDALSENLLALEETPLDTPSPPFRADFDFGVLHRELAGQIVCSAWNLGGTWNGKFVAVVTAAMRVHEVEFRPGPVDGAELSAAQSGLVDELQGCPGVTAEVASAIEHAVLELAELELAGLPEARAAKAVVLGAMALGSAYELADWGREDDSTAARLRPMLRRIGRAGANARHEGTRALKVKLKLDLP